MGRAQAAAKTGGLGAHYDEELCSENAPGGSQPRLAQLHTSRQAQCRLAIAALLLVMLPCTGSGIQDMLSSPIDLTRYGGSRRSQFGRLRTEQLSAPARHSSRQQHMQQPRRLTCVLSKGAAEAAVEGQSQQGAP